MCSYLNENELTGRRPQKVHETRTGDEEKLKRKISVGFSKDYMNIPSLDDENIYVALNLYSGTKIIELRGSSHNPFLIGGQRVLGFNREIKTNPCIYIRGLAKENDCEIDYSPAIYKGLSALSGIETIVKEGAKLLDRE